MPIDHTPGKPHVGSIVHFFNQKLLTGVGMGNGHEGRQDGPYAAMVTNNLGNGLHLVVYFPGIQFDAREIPHKDGVNAGSANGYWDWRSPADAMRAAKELKDTKVDAGAAE